MVKPMTHRFRIYQCNDKWYVQCRCGWEPVSVHFLTRFFGRPTWEEAADLAKLHWRQATQPRDELGRFTREGFRHG